MVFVARVLSPEFHGRNLVAYNFAGFACISLVVFLAASQPFYLSDVIGIDSDKIGRVTGNLGVADELVAIVSAPLIGTLNDRLQGYAWKSSRIPSGSRILQLAGFIVLGFSLLGYGNVATHVVPDLYILRGIFAIGVTCVMGIAVVMLHEASNSDFTWQKLMFWNGRRSDEERTFDQLHEDNLANSEESRRNEEQQLYIEEDDTFYSAKVRRYHGKLSALLGMCTGMGALLAVFVFLPLPANLSLRHANWTAAKCLQVSYTILGSLALIFGAFVFVFGYDSIKQRKLVHADVQTETPNASYFQLMKEAVVFSTQSRKLQLSYMGGFVARSTTIASSVFTPLMVYKFYSASGLCGTPSAGADNRYDSTQPNECMNAFIFSAILTGVSSTVSLVSTPIWSIIVDAPKLGCSVALFSASFLSAAGCFALCILGWSSDVYDPRNAWCFIALSFIGAAQMGAMIASMSLISKAGQSLADSEHRLIGSITGLYNLCGGFGILIIAKIGGTWSDRWVFGPFLILGSLNLILMAFASVSLKSIR